MANWRAIRQIVRQGDARRVAWDKTTHDFPVLGEQGRARHPLGRILVEQGAIDEAQLETALVHRSRGLKLGSWLVHEGVITRRQLAAAVAEQSGVPWENVDTLSIDPQLIEQLPAELALHYAVLPLREEGRTLVLASEGDLDPVSAAALGAQAEAAGLLRDRAEGAGHRRPAPLACAPPDRGRAAGAGRRGRGRPGAVRTRAEALWQEYVSRQVLFAEVLMSLGHLDAAALSAVLLRHERSSLSLGEYMVGPG